MIFGFGKTILQVASLAKKVVMQFHAKFAKIFAKNRKGYLKLLYQ